MKPPKQTPIVRSDGTMLIADDTLILITTQPPRASLIGSAAKIGPSRWRVLRAGMVDIGECRSATDARDLIDVDRLRHDAPWSMPRINPTRPLTVHAMIRLCEHQWSHVAGKWRCTECPASSDLDPKMEVPS